ncbi:MAG: lysophospholipase [Deltaproteobacteria bacterium]|nr:lysophospholipase [Deltaproteobacteria bacterium]
MSEPKTFELTAADGLVLRGYRWEPSDAPRGIVQIAHGMAEHALRYAEVAEFLAARGYLVVAHDHRGHGRSMRPGEEPGHMADEDAFAKAVEDLHRVNRLAAREHPGLGVALVGHSMGSFMSQNLAFAHPEDVVAVVLVASNGRPPLLAQAGRGVARLERARLGRRGRSTLLNKLSFEDFNARFRPNRTAFDWISRDEAVVDAYVADPLCGFMVSVQTWVDFLDALPTLTRPDNLARIPKDLPIYAVAGEQDPVGDMGQGVRRLVESYRSAGLRRVTERLYPGGRHEILKETNRADVLTDLAAWLEPLFPRPAVPTPHLGAC